MAIEAQQLKKLRSDGRNIHITLQLGKNGITPELVEELKKQLKKRKLVKIKLVRGFVEQLRESQEEGGRKKAKDIAQELAQQTDSEVVEAIGFVAVLWKR